MDVLKPFSWLSLSVVALSLSSAASHAATVTFDTGTHTNFGSSFTGSVTENGFTYSTASGSLFLSALGNPGQTMEGNEEFGGGVLNVVSASSGNFTFVQTDFSAFGATPGTETLTVTGFLNSVVKGVDTYTLADTSVINPTYSNWTTEMASNLAGVTINDLQITLNADPTFHSANIDNLVLGPAIATTPEPSTLVFGLTGMLALFKTAKRRIERA